MKMSNIKGKPRKPSTTKPRAKFITKRWTSVFKIYPHLRTQWKAGIREKYALVAEYQEARKERICSLYDVSFTRYPKNQAACYWAVDKKPVHTPAAEALGQLFVNEIAELAKADPQDAIQVLRGCLLEMGGLSKLGLEDGFIQALATWAVENSLLAAERKPS
jgi:hypothetical protein